MPKDYSRSAPALTALSSEFGYWRFTDVEDTKFLWVDIETTGLEPADGDILEVYLVLTGSRFEVIAERGWVINHSEEILAGMSDWCRKTHGMNGLIQASYESETGLPEAYSEIYNWLNSWVDEHTAWMAGSSVHFDRKWLAYHMPDVESYCHFRNLDATSVRCLFKLLGIEPVLRIGGDRPAEHRARDDIYGSIQMVQAMHNVIDRGVGALTRSTTTYQDGARTPEGLRVEDGGTPADMPRAMPEGVFKGKLEFVNPHKHGPDGVQTEGGFVEADNTRRYGKQRRSK